MPLHAGIDRDRAADGGTPAAPAAATGSCCRSAGGAPSSAGWSTATPGDRGVTRAAARRARRTGPRRRCPPSRGSGKLSAISCRHSTSKSARRLRLGDDARGIDAAVDAAAPLHVPGDQFHRESPARMNDCTNCRWKSRNAISSGAVGQQRRRRDDRPVDALVGRREHLQPDRQRPRLDRVGDDERPEEIVPVVADADQRVGEVRRAARAARRPSTAPAAALQPSTRAASSSSRGTVLNVWRSRKMPNALAMYGRPIARIVSFRPSAVIVR